MFESLIVLIPIIAGGAALTYIFVERESLTNRLAAGAIVGAALYGTICFAVANFAEFALAIAAAFVAVVTPLTLFLSRPFRTRLVGEWQNAKRSLEGAGAVKLLRFGYYLFFFVLLATFFGRAMIEMPLGIFTGASQNLGDLPFHLGAIFSFTDGGNFPPQNPSFAGAKFSYPFIADVLTAVPVYLGARVADAMWTLNVAWAMALLVLLERFVFAVTRDELAAKVAPPLLFFSGGLGFVAAFGDFSAQPGGLVDFLMNLPGDYTIGENYRWGNSLTTLFITQRSILLGMPLAVLVLTELWRAFAGQAADAPEKSSAQRSLFVVGLLAGTLALIHLHSLAVLFVVGVFIVAVRPAKWCLWLAFAAGAAITAVPEILWSLTGSASDAKKFVGWNFGWDKRPDENFLWFWILNTGLLIPTIVAGGVMLYKKRLAAAAGENGPGKIEAPFLFYLPFAFIFFAANVMKLAPWQWDNIKVLVYWLVGSLPFAAFALSWLWRQKLVLRVVAVACFFILTASGMLDVWRTVSNQISYKVFDRDAVLLAKKLKSVSPPAAVILNAPTYNSAAVLTGRLSVMRYTGHLSSHGIDYAPRERDVQTIYQGGPQAATLLQKYNVDYVIVSPAESAALSVNESFFAQFPVAAESGAYRAYKVK